MHRPLGMGDWGWMPTEKRPPRRPRMSFDLPVELIDQIKTTAHAYRMTLGKLAERAFAREIAFLGRRPPKRIKPGLRKGRPLKLPSRRRPEG